MMLGNAQAAGFTPERAIEFDVFAAKLVSSVQDGARVVAYFRADVDGTPLVIAVLGWDDNGRLEILAATAPHELPQLSDDVPSLAPFERAIVSAAQHGPPEAHHTFAESADATVHEVAVGPVHAGVIEPGHFRFHCLGETVLSLEIMLGYQKRGAEQLLLAATPARRLAIVQEVAGDATVAHATAYCQLLEALSGTRVGIRAHAIRAIALELERMANHVGDLGAMAGDIGYQPTAALCGRLRGSVLNVTAALCGNRFGRWLLAPGGVRRDVSQPTARDMAERLDTAMKQFLPAAARFLETPSVLHRFEGTGKVETETAAQLGLVGVAARACGLPRDVRHDYPSGFYALHQVPVAHANDGDVYARALVRRIEVLRAYDFVSEALRQLPEGEASRACEPLQPSRIAVALVEGWRGEVVHIGITDASGALTRYNIVDPSRHNWGGVSAAMTGQQISDFPLCNKSFNLSYAGHDL